MKFIQQAFFIFLLLFSTPPFLPAEVIRIMAANTTSGVYQAYEDPGIRIFQGLKPDIVLIQEFNYQSGTIRQLIDLAFGPEYYYYVEPGGEQIPNGIVSRWPIKASGEWNDTVGPSNRDFAWATIDVPGDIDLHVISVHLKSGESSIQEAEANLIKANVQANFSDSEYIVVGGDLNTTTRTSSAVTVFKSFLDADDHTPVDRNGNANTNAPRSSDYDWVMPNGTLDRYHTILYVGGADRAYPEGIVFDSAVFPNVQSEVFPVQNGDSHVSGMQHMAVMKAYDIPGRPTSTPSPSSTPYSRNLNSGDYNGDGTSDIAVFRGTYGLWSIRGITRVYFGGPGDIPVIGDYDGDDVTEMAVFRTCYGLWAVRDVTRIYYGMEGDLPVNSDYDGDANCDIGIFREASGLWAVRGVTKVYFGFSSDQPVPGDYDGDRGAEIAIFRPGTGMWAIRGLSRVYYGSSSDFVVPGDYNGDGIWELGIFRPSYGLWAIRGVTRFYFGGSLDLPVSTDYDGSGVVSAGIFRGTSGLWAIRGVSRLYFGGSSDIPVTR